MASKDPVIASLVATIAVLTDLARCPDLVARTEPARKALAEKWEREADPEGVLDPDERAKRADFLKRAHYKRMALRSATVRRANRDKKAGSAA